MSEIIYTPKNVRFSFGDAGPNRQIETYHTAITNDTIDIESDAFGEPDIVIPSNGAHFYFTSSDKDSISADTGDRRFAVFHEPRQFGKTKMMQEIADERKAAKTYGDIVKHARKTLSENLRSLNETYGKYSTAFKMPATDETRAFQEYCRRDVAYAAHAWSYQMSFYKWEHIWRQPVSDVRTWAIVFKFFREQTA